MSATSEIKSVKENILSPNTPITHKMRSLFYLRNFEDSEAAMAVLEILKSNSKSVLLKHEAAYVLGQMREECTIDGIIEILNNRTEHEVTRHEAAEALGNFKYDKKIFEALKNIFNSKEERSTPLKESCYLALKKIEDCKNNKNIDNSELISPFKSFDPSLPFKGDFEEAKKIFLSRNECLYKKYSAMFYLRNMNNEKSVEVLGLGFNDESALFRHEVAFVFGQMKNPLSIKFLKKVLEDENQHSMVRHEAAEALGAIGTPESDDILRKYINCSDRIVRESALVGLDISEYETGEEIEYCKF